jgi:hypothetical protein
VNQIDEIIQKLTKALDDTLIYAQQEKLLLA